MTIKSIEPLELSQILGSLMGAIISAQAQSARATVEFMEDVGFLREDGVDKFRTAKIRYSKKDEDGEHSEFEVEVPLLSMVNIPSIAVENANLSFSYDVVTAVQSDDVPGSGGSGGSSTTATSISSARLGLLSQKLSKPVKMTGLVKQKSSSGDIHQRSSTAIDVNITLRQQPLPAGIDRLFDLAELGITELQIEKEANGGGDSQ